MLPGLVAMTEMPLAVSMELPPPRPTMAPALVSLAMAAPFSTIVSSGLGSTSPKTV